MSKNWYTGLKFIGITGFGKSGDNPDRRGSGQKPHGNCDMTITFSTKHNIKRTQMEIPEIHPWPADENEALKIQYRLRDHVIIGGSLDGVKLIAGIDTAFDHNNEILFAGVCLYDFPELTEYERVTASAKAVFPYVPGLYSFREGPVILKALMKLNTRPDLMIVAGHGIAHPRRFGLASHLGLILDIPSIGCARKRLVGQHDEVGLGKDSSSPLIVDNEEVGRVYRTREKVKPLFISPGHRSNVDDAVNIVVKCLCGYRVPEPVRAAHRLANRAKRNNRIHS
jgi:deoxyribonuclease V